MENCEKCEEGARMVCSCKPIYLCYRHAAKHPREGEHNISELYKEIKEVEPYMEAIKKKISEIQERQKKLLIETQKEIKKIISIYHKSFIETTSELKKLTFNQNLLKSQGIIELSISKEFDVLRNRTEKKVKKDTRWDKIVIREFDINEIKKLRIFHHNQTREISTTILTGVYNNEPIAVKKYEILSSSADYSNLYSEARCYQLLSDKANNDNCFLKYYGTYTEGNIIYLVMEHIEYNLMDFLTNAKNQNYHFEEVFLISIFYKLLKTFTLMEEMNIYHGDIKPHNFLIDNFWNIKVIDFSITKIKNEAAEAFTGVNPVQGTKGYVTPEVDELLMNGFTEGKFKLCKSDVFSLGLVFLQLFTLRDLYGLNTKKNNSDLLSIVNNLKCQWAKSIIVSMLQINPADRPKFKELLEIIAVVHQSIIGN